jgi:hypothetical protein
MGQRCEVPDREFDEGLSWRINEISRKNRPQATIGCPYYALFSRKHQTPGEV